MVKGLEWMTSNQVTYLAWVRSPGYALVEKRRKIKQTNKQTLQGFQCRLNSKTHSHEIVYIVYLLNVFCWKINKMRQKKIYTAGSGVLYTSSLYQRFWPGKKTLVCKFIFLSLHYIELHLVYLHFIIYFTVACITDECIWWLNRRWWYTFHYLGRWYGLAKCQSGPSP
jgi:hypothetical protein